MIEECGRRLVGPKDAPKAPNRSPDTKQTENYHIKKKQNYMYILADFFKVSDKISIFSSIYHSFVDFFDVLKRYEQHLGNARNHT